MTSAPFARNIELLRMNCADHFRNAADQLENNPFGKKLPLRKIADAIDGVEDGLDKRLVKRFNAIKERVLAQYDDNPSSADRLDMLMIDVEHSATRKEIIDTARQDMKLFGKTRLESQSGCIEELENLQRILSRA